MSSLPMAAFVTLLTVLLLFVTALNVGRARVGYGIKAPAVSGHEVFERAFRIQMNTLENTVLMGIVWLVGRVWYAVAYQINPDKRGGGFGLAMLAFAGLWFGALWGVVRVMAH